MNGGSSGMAVSDQTGAPSAPSMDSVPERVTANSCIGSVGSVTVRPDTVSATESAPTSP